VFVYATPSLELDGLSRLMEPSTGDALAEPGWPRELLDVARTALRSLNRFVARKRSNASYTAGGDS
jgi:hypothetical protein